MSHSGFCPICENCLEKDLTCNRCNVQLITDNISDISEELVEQIKKMKKVSLEEVQQLAYQKNHAPKQKKVKIRKCSNKKYIKRKKSKNGKRKKK